MARKPGGNESFEEALKKVFADKEFLESLRKSFISKYYAGNTKLRVSEQSQIPEGVEQEQDEVSDLQEDV